MASKLGRWLGTLTQDQLAEILTRRPDALSRPVPTTLSQLADRLASRPSVGSAFHALPLPAVQLIEAIQAFGGPSVRPEQLAAAVGRTPDDPDLDATLRVLALRALVWPGETGELHMAGPLWSAFAYPLHLGPPAERLFSARNAPELRKVSVALGAAGGRTKQQIVHDLAAALRQGDVVRAAVAGAPEETRQMLDSIAWHGPVVRHPEIIYGYGHSPNPSLDWALSRGLLVADGWQAAVMPGEVGMALRGPDWRAPFTPQPPQPALTGADPDAVRREAAAASAAAVAGVTALLEACAVAPVTLLKAGGVGARELRRLGKVLGSDESSVRLWLELAAAAGLAGIAEQAVLPTAAYDEWRELDPASRLVPLLTAWWRLPAAPLAGRARTDSPGPALLRCSDGDLIQDLRREVLWVAADLPAGRGLANPDELGRLLAWRAPLLVGGLEDGEHLPAAMWTEARLLGVVAHGALSPLGRTLGDPSLVDVAGSLVPEAVGTALFQADLTAVVPGTPTAALAALLDSAADRESAGGAAIWRFSPGSVRRAFDAGEQPSSLLAALSEIAAGGVLPQPLEYLVRDIARRHGQIRVRSVACVLRADDPALLSEIAATRSLAPLKLSLLAPTVLASGRPEAETLAAVRAAGYAPVGEHPDGTPVIERVERRRATTPRARPGPARRAAGAPAAVRAASAPVGHAASAPAGHAASAPAGREGPAAARGGSGPTGPSALPAPAADLAAALLAKPLPVEDDDGTVSDVAGGGGRRSRSATGARRPAAVRTPGVDGMTAMIDFYATQLSAAERDILGHAVEQGGLVKIHYTNADGNPSARVIEPLALRGKVIEAWCHLREEERMFSLDRIDSVAPA